MSEIKASDGWLLHLKKGRLCLVVSRDEFWVGVVWDREAGMLYIAPLPAVVFGWRVRR